nr:type III polyketide synthase [Saprospiraceae bacterium]
QPQARILIICAESCTLHFRKTAEADDLLSTVLFGDGAAALIVAPDALHLPYSLDWVAQHATLVHAPDEMSWQLNDKGFEMKLSQEVPLYLEKHIAGAYRSLMEKSKGKKPDYYAIHPGGKNILKAFQRAMELSDDQIRHSYKVLRDFGNMSSPTVLFVLDEIQRDFLADKSLTEAWVFSAAFGPGLTIETALLKLSK